MFLKNIPQEERKIYLASAAWFFFALSAYYFLRPLRETMATLIGADSVKNLFVIVFLLILGLVPLYSWLVSKYQRFKVVSYSYRFFSIWLLGFAYFSYQKEPSLLLAKIFFIWLSVFNLFIVSIFWSVLAERFSSEQSKRLFGPIAAGGSLGGLLSSLIISLLGAKIPTTLYFLISFALLESALLASRKLKKHSNAQKNSSLKAIGGSSLSGFSSVLSSKYLLFIAIFTLLGKVCGTVVYLQLIEFVKTTVPDIAIRTQLFAIENLAVQLTTLAFQFFLTAYFLKRFSLKIALSFLPLTLSLGFLLFLLVPCLASAFILQFASRVLAYGLNSPAGEVLFTVVEKEDTYKAKSFIDTAVKRGGDVLGSKFYILLSSSTAGIFSSGILALTAVWGLIAYSLGTQQRQKAIEEELN